jgi:TetR/AcrR family transcriptional repressor of bet genes
MRVKSLCFVGVPGNIVGDSCVKGMPMEAATETTPAPRRKLSREERRLQLIEATISVIAENGFARTTLGEVARRAGLSHGLANFHFESKDKLLAATLDHLSEEYRANWQAALAVAGPHPADRIAALIDADFAPAICTADRLAAWCAFWGEAQSRPMYQESCGSNDEEYQRLMEGLCSDLVALGSYSGDAVRIARVLRVTTEGVWLDLMTMQNPYSREEAQATVWASAAAFFPRHFGAEGRLSGG